MFTRKPLLLGLTAATLALSSLAAGATQSGPQLGQPGHTAVSASNTNGERSRADVSREVQQAIRGGNWRCATNNKGLCDRAEPVRADHYAASTTGDKASSR